MLAIDRPTRAMPFWRRSDSYIGGFVQSARKRYVEQTAKACKTARARSAKRRKTNDETVTTLAHADVDHADAYARLYGTREGGMNRKVMTPAMWSLASKNEYATNDELYRGLPRPDETRDARKQRLDEYVEGLRAKAAAEWFPNKKKAQMWLCGSAFKTHFTLTFDSAFDAIKVLTELSAPFESEDERTVFELELCEAILSPIADEGKMPDGFGDIEMMSDSGWFRFQRKVERLCLEARKLFNAKKVSDSKMFEFLNVFERLNDVFWIFGPNEEIWRGCLNALQAPDKFRYVFQEPKDDSAPYSLHAGTYYWEMMGGTGFDKAIHGDKDSEGYKAFIEEFRAQAREKQQREMEKREEEARKRKEAELRTQRARLEREREQERERERERANQTKKQREYAEWVYRATGKYPVGYEAPPDQKIAAVVPVAEEKDTGEVLITAEKSLDDVLWTRRQKAIGAGNYISIDE